MVIIAQVTVFLPVTKIIQLATITTIFLDNLTIKIFKHLNHLISQNRNLNKELQQI